MTYRQFYRLTFLIGDDDLADMFAMLHITQCVDGLFERENLANMQRLNMALANEFERVDSNPAVCQHREKYCESSSSSSSSSLTSE